MPKKKMGANCKSAYYFFIKDKEEEYKRKGIRFRDLFAMKPLIDEWNGLDAQRRAKYDRLTKQAKETEKLDLTKKFTYNGESYAEVQERDHRNKMEENLLEEILSFATAEGSGLNRHFVIFKGIAMAEVNYPPNVKYYPAELAVASFKMDTGIASTWWTLVDTEKLPISYAHDGMETSKATCLPLPGSHKYQPMHRDHFNILSNLKNFILQDIEPIKGYYIVFVKSEEGKEVDRGILNWLLQKAKYETEAMKADYEEFVNSIKFIPVTRLLLKLAGVARGRTPTYQQEVVPARILSNGDWDYKENITCAFHNLDEARNMAYTCCRNIVLRTVFQILRELIPHMNIEPMSTHFVTSVPTMIPYEVPPPPHAPVPPPSAAMPVSDALKDKWGRNEEVDNSVATMDSGPPNQGEGLVSREIRIVPGAGASTSTYLSNAWDANSNPNVCTTDDFPALGTSGGFGMGRGRGNTGASSRP